MNRGVRILLAVVISLIVLPVAGFRLWLHQQPPETRVAIEAFSFLEFVEVVRDHFFPSPIDDNASYGRRSYPDRGHSPWLMRSSLDGRPRMLSLALAPGIWLAYSTETASIHQLWRGDIDFSGPAFDALHGAEPMSRGLAYLRPPAETAWRVREGERWLPARVRWRDFGVDPVSGSAWLRFDIADWAGNWRRVVEWPELVRSTADTSDTSEASGIEPAGRVELIRRFEVEVEAGAQPSIALEITAPVERIAGVSELDSEGRLRLAAGSTELRMAFDGPGDPIQRDVASPLEDDAFARFDCSTCHLARERAVGPAWSEVAQRHAGANRAVTAAQLAVRIREGSVGSWGSVAMPAHPDLGRDQAEALARLILETEPDAPARPEAGDDVASTYDYDVEPRPESLHPSLHSIPIDLPGFSPQVGGLAFLPDGRLLVTTWDRDGAVFAIEGVGGDASPLRIERIGEGLHEPLGIATVGDEIYVMQKQEITQLVDRDGDGWTDEYRTLSNDWQATSNFHEFGFGLVARGDFLYASLSVCILRGGKSCRYQMPDRGKVIRVSLETGEVEFVAGGFRTPNGLALSPDGGLIVTDNQGDWLPASKLMWVEQGDDYGWRPPGERPDPAAVTSPALWLPQNEIGNSPTQPVWLTQGPYAGQLLFGDIFNGGIKRGALEEVGGRFQGAAFHFSGGLRAPVNRLVAAPDGGLVAGQVGSRGNWGEPGKPWFGLEVLRFEDRAAFEPMTMELRPEGFDLRFTRPLAPDVELDPGAFRMQDWYYVPSELYGGPKYDVRSLVVSDARLSPDRRVVSLDVEGLEAGRVVYLRIDRSLRSDEGEPLWINEAWYTLNRLRRAHGVQASVARSDTGPSSLASLPSVDAGPPPNRLDAAERAAGWRLLFDGQSFAGWKIYGAPDDEIEGWRVRDGALEFTRDVSIAGLVWNHLNPFNKAALDLMTKERFGDFELSIDWKVSEGGNSGIFYLVPDEEASLAWTMAPEMQVLDDARHGDGQKEKRRAGDLYDVVASSQRSVRPAGEWNRARIRVEGDRIEHWLNDRKVVDITRGTPEWNRAIAAGKHAGVEGYALAREGHILLQDHGDPVWYRNIKILPLGD